MKLEFGQFKTARDATYNIELEKTFNKNNSEYIHISCSNEFGSHLWIDIKPLTLVKIIVKYYWMMLRG
jgi:hypothetical protein